MAGWENLTLCWLRSRSITFYGSVKQGHEILKSWNVLSLSRSIYPYFDTESHNTASKWIIRFESYSLWYLFSYKSFFGTYPSTKVNSRPLLKAKQRQKISCPWKCRIFDTCVFGVGETSSLVVHESLLIHVPSLLPRQKFLPLSTAIFCSEWALRD